MKTIPESYEGRGFGDQKGFSFKLVRRSVGVAVYSKTGHGGTSYETVKVRTHKKDRTLNGIKIAAAGDEYLPSSTQWGVLGWTYATLDLALAKMAELEEKNGKRKG